jgi:hypothetical protein
MSDAALDGGSAADTPLGQATPGVRRTAANDTMGGAVSAAKDLLRQSQEANVKGQAAVDALHGEVQGIKKERDIKEQTLSEQLQTLTNAQIATLKEKPPAPEPTSVAEQWGSPAMLLAIFASAFTRVPLTNALNAGAKVMQAYQQRDYDAANTAYKQWEHANDTAMKLTGIQVSMLEKAMTAVREASKEDINEKIAEVKLLVGPGALNIPALRALVDAGQIEHLGPAIDDMKANAAKAQIGADNAKEQHALVQAAAAADKELKEAQTSRDPEKIASATEKAKAAHRDLTEYGERQREGKGETPAGGKEPAFGSPDDLMKKWHQEFVKPVSEGGKGREPTIEETAKARANLVQTSKQPTSDLTYPEKWEGMPNSPPPGFDPGIWSAAITYVKSGGTIRPPFSLWGNNPMAVAFNQAIPAAQHALGITPEEMTTQNVQFAGQKRRETAIEGAFGGGVTGRNLISLNTVAAHIGLLREYGEALQNKDIPAANQIINRMATQAGMPEVIQYALARTITADEVVRLLTTTGGTVEDRQGLQSLLSEYASPAQIFGAVDTAGNFVAERLGPLEQQYARNDPAKRREFEDNMLTPQARELFLKGERKPGHVGAQAHPAWAKGVTMTPDGSETIYTDGKEWFHADHTPYKPKAE